ncbi:MAG TPA: thioredoxin family protein [Candidatus Acidoferrum sp.]|nr:thioredoxin family protein [Candidatus Acidoferrum sp.]
MALTPSNMLPLGTLAPDFALPGVDGNIHRLQDFSSASALLVMFICNHCPFVKHVQKQLVALARDYQARNVAVVAISSNDIAAYPADDMSNMKQEAIAAGYPFPYLLDESQVVARAYDAACTPDFFLFDKGRKLVYRGRLDASRPGNNVSVDGIDLRTALDSVLQGKPVAAEQQPSVGCNIKWRPGNQPA